MTMRSGATRTRALRGVSLIEMMVVIAILGIMAAIATPQLLPILKKSRLNTDAESVASFMNAVRERAIAKNRCYRVQVVGGRTLTADERNSGDCASTVNLTTIDGWNAASQRLTAEPGSTFLFAGADANSTTGTLASDIIFRPSGRLRGDNDLNTVDDRIRIRITQTGLANEQKHVVVMGSGRICVIHVSGVPPAMTPANASNDCTLAIP